MGDFRLPLRSDKERNAGEKWDVCCLCGALLRRAMVHFKQGTVTPTSGETVTGASSGDTGVLNRYVLVSGTVAGGDAEGILEFTSPSGYDDGNLEIFTKDESLNGSTSGNAFCVAKNTGAVQISGRLIADGELIEYQGKKYCSAHFPFKFRQTWLDEVKMPTDEGDRE